MGFGAWGGIVIPPDFLFGWTCPAVIPKIWLSPLPICQHFQNPGAKISENMLHKSGKSHEIAPAWMECHGEYGLITKGTLQFSSGFINLMNV